MRHSSELLKLPGGIRPSYKTALNPTAREARQIAIDSLGTVYKPLLDHIYARIRKAAAEGKTEIYHPLHGYERPSSAIESEIWSHFTVAGYTVDHRPDPDPGSPGSGPYTVILW